MGPARVRRAEVLLRDRAEEPASRVRVFLSPPAGRDGVAGAVAPVPASLAHGGLGCPDRLLGGSSDFRKFEAKLHQLAQSLQWQVV